ncbi:MAG: WGR domain-containing protein [Paracoccaceae bacterium]
MVSYLVNRSPARNRHRFYRLDVAPDLFGAWCLVRGWGRIGTRGQQKIDAFASADEARRAMARLAASKKRRGYRDGG